MKKFTPVVNPRVVDKDAPPCEGCYKVANFAFKGCAKNCDKMFAHLKKIFSQNCSPCLNLRCGIPGANNAHTGICVNCRMRETYAKREEGIGPKSVLGNKPPTPYVTEWDIKHGVKN